MNHGRPARRKAAGALLLAAFLCFSSAATAAEGTAAPPAPGPTVGMALRDLGSSDAEKVKAALLGLAERGDAAAIPALEALLDDRLRAGPDGAVYIWDARRDLLLDALTRAPVTSIPAPLREVETDNELRRFAAPMVARLRLSAADPSVRLTAAEELAASGGDEVLPLMQAALAREPVKKVREALSLALARHDLASPDVARKLAALETLRQLARPAVKHDIEEFLKVAPDGTFLEKDERLRKAAASALSSIHGREMILGSVGNVLYGVSLSSVFLFAALGLAITFGVMGVINMAHGEMLTIGAYSTYVVQNLFQRHLPPSLFPYYLVAAIPVAFVAATATGIVLERGIIRHLYGRPLETLLATWGISLALIQTIRLIFGAANVAVANPSWLAGGTEVLSGITVPYNRIGVILFVIAAAAFVWFLLQRTRLGLQVRAVTQNRSMAACMGVSTRRIDMWTFGLGSGIAGLGGVALSQIGNVGPELGQGYILDSFMVVVLGGVGRIAGTVGAALGLGIVQKFLEPISGAVLGKIAVLVVIIVFIQRRPQGMFPVKGRVEA
jgi:urea transport system permease protein